MYQFLNWLKTYIEAAFTSDTEITKTVVVENAYKQGNTVNTTNVPQVQIQLLDNSEVERYSSFQGEHLSYVPVQLSVYSGQMKINETTYSAQDASIILGDKVKSMVAANEIQSQNKNIKRCIRTSMSPALQLIDGSKVYYTAVRVEFWIANPYVAEVIAANN